MSRPKIRTATKEVVIRMYQKGLPFSAIQNLTGWPSKEASDIVKEAGLFNPKKQHDYFREKR